MKLEKNTICNMCKVPMIYKEFYSLKYKFIIKAANEYDKKENVMFKLTSKLDVNSQVFFFD